MLFFLFRFNNITGLEKFLFRFFKQSFIVFFCVSESFLEAYSSLSTIFIHWKENNRSLVVKMLSFEMKNCENLEWFVEYFEFQTQFLDVNNNFLNFLRLFWILSKSLSVFEWFWINKNFIIFTFNIFNRFPFFFCHEV